MYPRLVTNLVCLLTLSVILQVLRHLYRAFSFRFMHAHLFLNSFARDANSQCRRSLSGFEGATDIQLLAMFGGLVHHLCAPYIALLLRSSNIQHHRLADLVWQGCYYQFIIRWRADKILNGGRVTSFT